MKLHFMGALAFTAALAGCGGAESTEGAPLSRAECEQLENRMNSLLKAETGVDISELASNDTAVKEHQTQVIEYCVKGETYTRADFECVKKASNTADINSCNLTRHM